ncbi:1-aminocyclopropane-1-carboxylate deaminase/D-cysteine desulfhydrase [Glaciecola sp. 2405UD65-10]|uniref:1-aminocyclopropane-1-carboxylate deaminase/D-cysteine desulfhydrase n=1 Tax=Glaciecola sp. 2405UD65-10 TaxID=3397244 RepID=UPI003B5C6611
MNKTEAAQKTFNINLPSPIERITWPGIGNTNASLHNEVNETIEIYVKRDDLIHPVISGNKWRKLLPFVSEMQSKNVQHVLSFGGGYSNHLHALAYLCDQLNIKLSAIIRGDYTHNLSPTLQDMKRWGAELRFVNRIEYKQRHDPQYCQALQNQFQADLLIPEGGSHALGIEGVKSFVDEFRQQLPEATHVIVPVASGGTMAGIIGNALRSDVFNLIGIAVLKGESYLEDLVNELLPPKSEFTDWHIEHEYHHKGYAKSSETLQAFMRHFENHTNIPLEAVYSGKCFYALDQLLRKQYFPANSKIMITHTGGLQGKTR